MTELEMATRDELLNELKSRCDELVVIARSLQTADTESRFTYFKGSPASAYGNAKKLLLYFESVLRAECIDEIEWVEPENETGDDDDDVTD